MPDLIGVALALRSLLTEFLPYEVPVIFSNDRLYASLIASHPANVSVPLQKLREFKNAYTVPYNYTIAKSPKRTRALSIMHPLVQVAMADFYELHAGGMLSHCANSRFSLRRPTSMASPFYLGPANDADGRLKLGVAQLASDEGAPDTSHMSSYFQYGKYNLLGKFIASREFIRLEAKYLLYRSLDVSKCFYNIYTHSVTWAVKGKPFSKANVNMYSFEARFDKLMQLANYNETNGIVVGPEVSRIFAEIILQSVDASVESSMASQSLKLGADYDVRRYVDDYFVFSNSPGTLDLVETAIREELEKYKLYINEQKIETHQRPFVSSLSLARHEIGKTIKEISRLIFDARTSLDDAAVRRDHEHLKSLLRDIRLIVAKHHIEFANISGWLMSRLRRVVRQCITDLPAGIGDGRRELLADIAISVLEQGFYICSLDFRVRTTYSICQLALLIISHKASFSDEQYDLANHIMADQIVGILRSARSRDADTFGTCDFVEVFNLLICGSQFVGEDFVHSNDVQKIMATFAAQPRLTYFTYITLKFCYLKDSGKFNAELASLNQKARDRILAPGVRLDRDTEEYLFLQDYLSAPDIADDNKRDVFNLAYGTQIGKAIVPDLSSRAGSVDWTGLSVEHLLLRKELRPVYSWG